MRYSIFIKLSFGWLPCLLIRNDTLVCLSSGCEDKERRKEIKQGTQMKYIVNTLLSGVASKSPCFFFSLQAPSKLLSFAWNFCTVIQSTPAPKIPVWFYFAFY